jgi:hypothetical protein
MEKVEFVGEYIVACSFRNVEDQFTWTFAGVYCPNYECDRRFLWDELARLLNWWNFPWCIRRGFNVSHFPSERWVKLVCVQLWGSP